MASFQATQSDMEDYLDDYEDDQVLTTCLFSYCIFRLSLARLPIGCRQ